VIFEHYIIISNSKDKNYSSSCEKMISMCVQPGHTVYGNFARSIGYPPLKKDVYLTQLTVVHLQLHGHLVSFSISHMLLLNPHLGCCS